MFYVVSPFQQAHAFEKEPQFLTVSVCMFLMPDARDVIGDDVPRLLEVTEQVGCRMMHMFPWEAEIGVQLALALCRRKTPPEETKTVDSQEVHILPKILIYTLCRVNALFILPLI